MANMNKPKIRFLSLTMIFIAGALLAWTANARADQSTSIDPEEKDQIAKVVRDYFEARYRSFNTLELEGFEGLIDESLKGNSFKRSEFEKLDIELDHARFYHLRYLWYELFLDFKEISINSFNGLATVYVVEGHDVEFEISREISRSGPVISVMRNLQHTFVLQKKNGVWKIVSDNYEDYLWRLMKANGLSKKDLIQTSENSKSISPENDGDMIEATSCNLPYDQSTYPYNRIGVVNYAHQYAINPNPDYYYYPRPYGDCTNFISQAIYEGGGALMVGTGTLGWYYKNVNDHSPSWTNVQYLYDFIVEPGYSYWPAGPEGCDTSIGQAEKGDVIQYNWKENEEGTPDPTDQEWDHSVFIVQSQYDPTTFHWVAAHTDNMDGYPYTYFIYEHPNMITRFVHIVRLDGARLFIPLVRKNITGKASQMQNLLLSPYPTILEEDAKVKPLPYPAPMELSEPSIQSSYPAP